MTTVILLNMDRMVVIIRSTLMQMPLRADSTPARLFQEEEVWRWPKPPYLLLKETEMKGHWRGKTLASPLQGNARLWVPLCP